MDCESLLGKKSVNCFISHSGGYIEGSLNPVERQRAQLWMEKHDLSQAGLDLVVKGQVQPRLFLPLSSQQLAGRVVAIVKAGAVGVSLTIQTSCGRVVQADRSVAFAFGWWLGKADLVYCMQDGKCLLQIQDLYKTLLQNLTYLLFQSKCFANLSPVSVLEKMAQPLWFGSEDQGIVQDTRDLTPSPSSPRLWTLTSSSGWPGRTWRWHSSSQF